MRTIEETESLPAPMRSDLYQDDDDALTGMAAAGPVTEDELGAALRMAVSEFEAESYWSSAAGFRVLHERLATEGLAAVVDAHEQIYALRHDLAAAYRFIRRNLGRDALSMIP